MSEEPNLTENEPAKTESASDTDLRIQSHPDTPLPIQKKKSKKKLIIFLVLALLVIGVAIAAVVYYVVPKYTAPKVVKDDTGYATATKFESAKKLIDQVNPNLKGGVVQVAEATGFGGKTADGFGAYSVPVYKVGDRKYSNLPGATTGASYKGSSTEAASNYTALTTFFKKNNFKQLTSGKDTKGINQWFSSELQYVSYATYESSNLLCMIWHVDATPTSVKNHVTSVGCADKSSYEAAAKELDQYYTAYAKGTTGGSEVVLGMPMVSLGADNTYINAVVYQEDPDQLDTQFQGLYYKTNGQKEWTYFTGAYGLLSCTEYNTDVLKKAFKGFSCYVDASKSYSTVQ
ncbi:MAG: hypothetical protein JWN75_11 [Candidatus Saccharibacteria bacterium]|nr:hypothetical protein [Candidatus Saccharibacteria bacterium]